MARENLLFSELDWHFVDQNQRKQMALEIEAVNPDRLLNSSVDDLASYFEYKYRIDVPALKIEELVVDQREKQIDVSLDPRYSFLHGARSRFVPGTEIEVEIPFSGDPEAFKIRPNPYNYNPPSAWINSSKVIFSIVRTNLDTECVRREIDSIIQSIQMYLDNLRNNANTLNNQLLTEAKNIINTRRSKLLSDRNLVGSLGFKMKERTGSVQTYVPSEIRRKITPVMPSGGSAPYKPEPALSKDDYEHILSVMQNMTRVMELSPSAFLAVNEEALRSHFLVQLNGHYEGQATGETFNYEGKTDILIRSEGRNIFIAECKFWSGPKKLSETIDQLLSYSSWRDTKTAIVIFNRNRDFSNVLAAIPKEIRSHPQYKRDLPGSTDTMFRYCFANRDDRNRELFLTILAFDIPTPRQL